MVRKSRPIVCTTAFIKECRSVYSGLNMVTLEFVETLQGFRIDASGAYFLKQCCALENTLRYLRKLCLVRLLDTCLCGWLLSCEMWRAGLQ